MNILKKWRVTWQVFIIIRLCTSFLTTYAGSFPSSIDESDVTVEAAPRHRGRTKRCVAPAERRCRRRYNSCGKGPYIGISVHNPYMCCDRCPWNSYYWGPSYWGYTWPYRGYYYAGPQFGIGFSV